MPNGHSGKPEWPLWLQAYACLELMTLGDVLSRRAFGAVDDVELDLVALVQGPEPFD